MPIQIVKRINRTCKTCLQQHFERIMYKHICDPG